MDLLLFQFVFHFLLKQLHQVPLKYSQYVLLIIFENLFNILSSTLPEIAIANTGNLDKFTSVTTGSSVSSGNLFLIKSIFTLVSDKVLSESKPASNSKIIFPPPKKEFEESFFIPSIFLSSFSKGLIRSLSESDEDIPLCFKEI